MEKGNNKYKYYSICCAMQINKLWSLSQWGSQCEGKVFPQRKSQQTIEKSLTSLRFSLFYACHSLTHYMEIQLFNYLEKLDRRRHFQFPPILLLTVTCLHWLSLEDRKVRANVSSCNPIFISVGWIINILIIFSFVAAVAVAVAS
uniref:Uncharacterized protein n=1 Tax=Glossina austeni TaxID=7395 RepID=A0A1A9ULG9_GLOAU